MYKRMSALSALSPDTVRGRCITQMNGECFQWTCVVTFPGSWTATILDKYDVPDDNSTETEIYINACYVRLHCSFTM